MNDESKRSIIGSIGTLGGLYYAFSKNKSFWGYVGFGFLGSVVGYTIGRIVFPVSPTITFGTPTTTTESDSEKKS